MTTIKGFIRSYNSATRVIRKGERKRNKQRKEAAELKQKRARELAKKYKEQTKNEEIANAKEAVVNHNEYIDLIISFHKNCGKGVNWQELLEIPCPVAPSKSSIYETEAQAKLDKFKPSFFNKLLNTTDKKIEQLKNALKSSKEQDQSEFELAKDNFNVEFAEWNLLHKMAKGVIGGDYRVYADALQYFDPFSDMGELGTKIQFAISDEFLDLELHIKSEEIIPTYELRQLASGKLSKKKMSKSKFNELYQDHVCSSIIRVARELFASLPLKKARINAVGQVLNKATGHIEETPILSVIMIPETIKAINLDTIDPSDSLCSFVHNMKFSKTKGFSAVGKVEIT